MTTAATRPKIVLLGDSLTQLCFEGWGAQLAHVYQRRADVLNRGYSGYNTTFYLHHVALEPLDEVCLVLIFFGANDAALPDQDPHHYVPLEEYARNLNALIHRVNTLYDNPRILLIAPPPIHHEQRLQYQKQRYKEKATGVLERTLENTGKYAATCVEVAKECNIPYIDLYHDMLQQAHWDTFFHDGLHFAPAGHVFVAERILETIRIKYPDIHVGADPVTGQHCNSSSHCISLSSQGPYHDEIDRTKL